MTEASPRRRMPAQPAGMSIGALARATRIPAETLRTWERRYGSPRPERRPSGHRRYPSSAVDHLRRVNRLIAQGHRPGDVLPLSEAALEELLAASDPTVKGRPGAGRSAEPEDGSVPRGLAEALDASRALDRDRLLGESRALWVRLGPLRFLQDFAGPLMAAIGRGWKGGSIEIRHEHFASSCLSDFLREVRQPFDRQARGPFVLMSTLPGDAHEGGLLMASVLMSSLGYRLVYLGADTPLDQIAEAAQTAPVDAVMIGVSSALPRRRAAAALAQLRDALPRRMPLWTGGSGAPEDLEGIRRFASLDALDDHIRSISPPSTGRD